MIEVRKTETYAKWLDGLRDIHARARVQVRVERLAAGNPGDIRPVGDGVSELRIDYGPGYRIYFTMRGHWLEAINALRPPTSGPHCVSRATYRSKS